MTPDRPVRVSPASRALERSLRRALRKQKSALDGLASEPIHDVRVAIRRCRSLAEGFASLDPQPVWRHLRKVCKQQQRGLTDLRDVQVMTEWVKRLGLTDGPSGDVIVASLEKEERRARRKARAALASFPRKRWKRWRHRLPIRAELIPVGQPRLAALAWERLTEVCQLDRRWRSHRGAVAWHQLRVAVKRFRYVVESFLPEQSAAWDRNLSRLQDLLGEGHDLDVLRGRIIDLAREQSLAKSTRDQWLRRIERARLARATDYEQIVFRGSVVTRHTQRNVPRQSLWENWRADLALLARFNLPGVGGLLTSGARRASPARGRALPYRGMRLRTSSTR